MNRYLIAFTSLFLFAASGCLVRYSGTPQERRVPLGGYIAGGVAIGGGLLLAYVCIEEVEPVQPGDETETRITSKAGFTGGLVLAGAGVATVVASLIYHAISAAGATELPYSPPPRFHRGDWARSRSTGARVYVYSWEATYETDEGLRRVVPVVRFWVCSHAGPSAECWWVPDEDLVRPGHDDDAAEQLDEDLGE